MNKNLSYECIEDLWCVNPVSTQGKDSSLYRKLTWI